MASALTGTRAKSADALCSGSPKLRTSNWCAMCACRNSACCFDETVSGRPSPAPRSRALCWLLTASSALLGMVSRSACTPPRVRNSRSSFERPPPRSLPPLSGILNAIVTSYGKYRMARARTPNRADPVRSTKAMSASAGCGGCDLVCIAKATRRTILYNEPERTRTETSKGPSTRIYPDDELLSLASRLAFCYSWRPWPSLGHDVEVGRRS